MEDRGDWAIAKLNQDSAKYVFKLNTCFVINVFSCLKVESWKKKSS